MSLAVNTPAPNAVRRWKRVPSVLRRQFGKTGNAKRAVLSLPVAMLMLLSVLFPPKEANASQIEIHLWHRWGAEKRERLESVVSAFNCDHKDIRVIATSLGPLGGSVVEQMKLSDPSELPELALVEREAIPELADSGIIVPIEKLLAESASLHVNNWFDSALTYGTYEEEVYGIPAYLNPIVLIYDPGLLSKAGPVAPPAAWMDFFTLAQTPAGKKADGVQWVLSQRSIADLFFVLCTQNRIRLLETGNEREPVRKVIEVLDFIRSLRNTEGALSPHYKFWDHNFADITSGKVLFQIDSAQMLAHLLETASLPLAVSQAPSDSRPALTYLSHSPLFVVSKQPGRERAALRFLEFFYGSERYSRLAEKMLFIHPVQSAAREVEKSVRNHSIPYPRLVAAAQNAEVFPLRANTGPALSEISRIVEQLDAGLLSSEHASKKIAEVVKRGAIEDISAPRPHARILWAESTRRLYQDGGEPCRGAPVTLTAARNEHETFQLALSVTTPHAGLRVHVLPFDSDDGEHWSAQTAAYLQEDTRISSPLAAERHGLYPNALREATQFDAEPGKLVRLWMDVLVPEQAPTGIFSSRIVISGGDEVVAEMPLRLRVVPLMVPRKSSHPAVIGLNYDLVDQHYGFEDSRRLKDSFYWFLVEHRLSPFQPPVPVHSVEAARYLGDERVSGCRLPFLPSDPRLQSAVNLADQGGWLGKLFVYFIDEPTYHQYGVIKDLGQAFDSLQPPPAFMVTCFPDDLLLDAVDIWCVHMRFLPEGLPHGFRDRKQYFDLVRNRLAAGADVWWYTAGAVRPVPTLHIEDAPTAFRIIPWLQRLCGITGFLHWESANWTQPIDDPFISHFGNGEGVLVYPGDEGPMPSIRLKLLREGFEDMELLFLMQQQIENLQGALNAERLGDIGSRRVREMCRRLISDRALRTGTNNESLVLSNFFRKPGTIERVREQVIEETLNLMGKPSALVLTEPEEKQYTDTEKVRVFGAVEEGCLVEVNGTRATVDARGGFSVTLPLDKGLNVFTIRILKGQERKVFLREILRF